MFNVTIPGERKTPCADDPDLMFDPQQIERAKAQCDGCWFFAQCAEQSADEDFGVWAGEVKPGTLAELSARGPLQDHNEIAAVMLAEGLSRRELADRFGVSLRTVDRATRELRAAA